MSIILIAAVARNRVIGKDNDLVWRDKSGEDMARFKRLTTGHTVLMGRKTWESLPVSKKTGERALPNRLNAVITAQMDYALPQGVLRFGSVQEALEQLARHGDIYVIGGGQLYAKTLPVADVLQLTMIDQDLDGDVTFPTLDENWELTASSPPVNATGFRFETYHRVRTA